MGHLNSFRTKTDAYQLVKVLIESFKDNSNEYKKFLYSSSRKDFYNLWISYLLENDELPFVDTSHKALYTLRTDLFKTIFTGFFECFGENAVRYSFYNEVEKKLVFELPKTQLLTGISSFYHRLSPFKIPIFYNNAQIKTWTSNIKFERDQSKLDWFEMNLVVNQEDWNLIQKADVNDNVLLTDTGLILLDKKERDILKFIKKYTHFEKIDENTLQEDQLKKFALTLKRARIFELFELRKMGIDGALTKEEIELCTKLENLEDMPHHDLPEEFQGVARHYQETGFQWLNFLYENKFGACLADDMGLGKTLQTIMFLKGIIHRSGSILIVCPVSILMNWQNEINKFSDMEVGVYYGDTRELDISKKIILTSYGVMKKEAQSVFAPMIFDVVIFDEVQHLKNIRSQGANAARAINANFRICLTGTPVENDLSEFYNIMDLALPGIWGEINFVKTTSTQKSRLLARKTARPFILRRTKAQVLTELPPKTENQVFLDFSEKEKEQYLLTLGNINKKMDQVQEGRKYGEILKSLLQLRQLCLWQKHGHFHSTKIEFLLDTLEQIIEEGHKAIIFSQFTTYLDIIQDKFKERSWKYCRIDGSQSFKRRAEEVVEFQEGSTQLFLISLKAGGVGLNLTAASYIFLMDPWWNPAVENQAIDRAHRIGQENKLTVYRPIIKGSVEEKVMILQQTKRELFSDLMADNDIDFYNGKLTMQDFKGLLNLE